MQTLLIDIGGSGIKYATLKEETAPALANEGKLSGIENSTEAMVAAIASIYNQFRNEVDAIAVCACMVLDTKTGYVYAGGTYHNIRNVNLAERISAACDGKPVTIESDGDCCLRAELKYGALQGCENAGVFVFGTGIGCAFITDGHILTGHNATAGEVSFCAADSRYSNRHPLFWGSVSGMGGACARLCERMAVEPGTLNGFDLFRMVREGSTTATNILDEMCDEASRQIYNACLMLSPEKIAIGGGISGEPELIERLQNGIQTYYKRIEKFTACCCPQIVQAQYRNQANLLGAYARLQEIITI